MAGGGLTSVRSWDTSGECYCQARVGDGMPAIWEEHKLCAHPTDLFTLLLCCLMSNICVNHLKSKKVCFLTSLFGVFFPHVVIFLKDEGMFFLSTLAYV